MNEPIIDNEWRALARKAKTLIPNDEEENQAMLEDYSETGESPRGCTISNGTGATRQWMCKMYLGGKQRVLGYGTCYQCALLYDAAYWRFKQYRIDRDMCGTMEYNFGEVQAGDSNLDANIISLLSEMEELLKSRGLLKTAEEREAAQKQRKAEYQSNRYTAKGRIEGMVSELFQAVGKLEKTIDELAKQNAQLIKRVEALETKIEQLANPFSGFRPINVWPAPNQISPTPMHVTPGVPFGDPIVTCGDATNGTLVCKTEDSVQ